MRLLAGVPTAGLPLEQIEPATAVADYIAMYLSDPHVTHPERGCPMPALGADIARASGSLKREFGAGLAAIMARLGEVIYGVPDPKMGCLGGATSLHELPKLNHRLKVQRGVLSSECHALLKAYFKEKREEGD